MKKQITTEREMIEDLMETQELICLLENCMIRNNPQCDKCKFDASKNPILTCEELLSECISKLKELSEKTK